jgi:hypothetical protein
MGFSKEPPYNSLFMTEDNLQYGSKEIAFEAYTSEEPFHNRVDKLY